MEDAAASPAAPTSAATPAPPEAGAAPAPAPTGPDPAAARSSKLRLQAKVAGVMMMLFGAFFALNFALVAYNGPRLADTYAAIPGGNVTVAFPAAPGAEVDLTYASGAPATRGRLDGAGSGTFRAANATVTLRVAHANATWTRSGFVPPGATATVRLDPASPRQAGEPLGVDTAAYRWFWLPAVASALVAAGGVFAFRLRGPRLALGGAFLFMLGAGLLATLFGAALLAVSFVGTAVLCFYFLYRARTEFQPLRQPLP